MPQEDIFIQRHHARWSFPWHSFWSYLKCTADIIVTLHSLWRPISKTENYLQGSCRTFSLLGLWYPYPCCWRWLVPEVICKAHKRGTGVLQRGSSRGHELDRFSSRISVGCWGHPPSHRRSEPSPTALALAMSLAFMHKISSCWLQTISLNRQLPVLHHWLLL